MATALLVLVASSAPAAAAATPNCADVKVWEYTIPGAYVYFLVNTGSGWVVSYSQNGSNPFANAQVSVSGASFHAHSVYTGGNTGYVADASGTLSSSCTIGVTTPLGRWHSNHDPAGGTFTMSPLVRAKTGCDLRHARRLAAATDSCLIVKIAVAAGRDGSHYTGLSWDRGSDAAAFVRRSASGLGPPSCLSGCVNVNATVRFSDGNDAGGASVTASVSAAPPGGIAPYPNGESGSGHVCNGSTPVDCGTSVTVTADGNGKASFLYWAPGLISPHGAKVTVHATASCDAGCQGTTAAVPVSRVISLKPYELVNKQIPLTSDEIDAILDWARPDLAGSVAPSSLQTILEKGLKLLHQDGPASAVGQLATIVSLLDQYGKERALTEAYLSDFGISPFFIGAEDTLGFDTGFIHSWAGQHALGDGFTKGVLYRYGDELAALITAGKHAVFSQQTVTLKLDEVSYCLPGYDCSPKGVGPGIRRYLYFDFQAGDPPEINREFGLTYPAFEEKLIVAYNASAWMRDRFS